MVTITLCIIAICEVVRAVQNAIQIRAIHGDVSARENVYSEFVNSLKSTDKEFVERILREFDEDKDNGKPMENDGDDL